MTFRYAWLKIPEIFAKGHRAMSMDVLRADLGRHRFFISETGMEENFAEHRDQALV